MNTERNLRRELDAGRFEQTEAGLLIPAMGAVGRGEYLHRKNEGEWALDTNTLTEEFLDYLLAAGMNGSAAISNWYMTLMGVGFAPAPDWTAATFAASGAENTDAAEGYDATSRPAWVLDAPAAGLIANGAAATRFTIAATSTVNIGGIATLSSDVRGGSSGILVSASELSSPRSFESGDTYDVIYRLRFEAA